MQAIAAKVIPTDRQIRCLALEWGRFMEVINRTANPNIKTDALLARMEVLWEGCSPRSATKAFEWNNNMKNKYRHRPDVRKITIL